MTVLIVDDSQDVITLFEDAALFQGCTEINTARSGEEALAFVMCGEYDLLSLDLQMPGVSGLQSLPMLRIQCPHAIIAIISGNIPENPPRELTANADVLIPKPVSVSTFKRLLSCTARIAAAREEIQSLGTGACGAGERSGSV